MKILITGGAGFIGVNAAAHFCDKGWTVTVLDNLSRRGSPENLEWLKSNRHVEFIKADIRENAAVANAVSQSNPTSFCILPHRLR